MIPFVLRSHIACDEYIEARFEKDQEYWLKIALKDQGKTNNSA